MVVPLTLFLVALCARILTGALFPDPAYPDSFYYVNVARELAAAAGGGLASTDVCCGCRPSVRVPA